MARMKPPTGKTSKPRKLPNKVIHGFLISGRRIAIVAPTRSEARSILKAKLRIPKKGRLPIESRRRDPKLASLPG